MNLCEDSFVPNALGRNLGGVRLGTAALAGGVLHDVEVFVIVLFVWIKQGRDVGIR
jgi:hypothetical protein